MHTIMQLIDVYTALRKLGLPIFQTNDAAAYLNISVNHVNKLLSRIAKTKQILHLKHGVWIFPDVEPLALPGYLTSPFPAYVSLQSALYYRGMISQIPAVLYAVSVARTHFFKTPIVDVSIHHIQRSFFFGFEIVANKELIKIATPEKALLDIFYLSQTKTRLFHALPEVELPKTFSFNRAKKMIDNITSIRKRTLVKNRFSEFVESLS